jgi:hypothetical protein
MVQDGGIHQRERYETKRSGTTATEREAEIRLEGTAEESQTAAGGSLEGGDVMLLITARSAGLKVELVCSLCSEPLTLQSAWLAFPPNPLKVPGLWVHRPCINGRVHELFGVAAVTLLSGPETFRRLAEDFEERREAM